MKALQKSKWRFVWIIPMAILGVSALAELLGLKFVVAEMTAKGMSHLIFPLGILKLVCITVFLIPTTRRIGFLLCTAYIGGIIAADLVQKEPPLAGILLQSLLWVGMYFEVPPFFYLQKSKVRTDDGVRY